MGQKHSKHTPPPTPINQGKITYLFASNGPNLIIDLRGEPYLHFGKSLTSLHYTRIISFTETTNSVSIFSRFVDKHKKPTGDEAHTFIDKTTKKVTITSNKVNLSFTYDSGTVK